MLSHDSFQTTRSESIWQLVIDLLYTFKKHFKKTKNELRIINWELMLGKQFSASLNCYDFFPSRLTQQPTLVLLKVSV